MWNTGGTPLPITDRMKKNGTHIFTVAVGEANNANVKALASLPLSKYFYNVTNEGYLPLILHQMVLALCDRATEHNEAYQSGTRNNVDKVDTADTVDAVDTAKKKTVATIVDMDVDMAANIYQVRMFTSNLTNLQRCVWVGVDVCFVL